ncbi:MAG: ribonuclease E/G, partial [Acidobacteriota bacterium]
MGLPDQRPGSSGKLPDRGQGEGARTLRRELVVNRTSTETRVALLEAGRLTEVFIERDENRSLVGNVYKGRVVKILPGMQSAFVAVGLRRDAFLHVHDVIVTGRKDQDRDAPTPRIEEVLREGQDVLVQLTKEPIAGKGARITTNVTLPGRRLVLIPAMGYVGVSRRIEEPDERSRLRDLVTDLRRSEVGYIVRTAGLGSTRAD